MDKRYQVFVSSTYTDLVEERRHVTQALLEMDCIPAGMEMFPAIDEEQFEFIKKIIDDSDYYLLVIGGRYGSIDAEGVSYTEKEYDYAVSKKILVIALLHANPSIIASGKTEQTEEGRAKLAKFREKARSGRLVREWNTPEDLAGHVSRSLHRTISMLPAVGWVRADRMASDELVNKLYTLTEERDSLKRKLEVALSTPEIEDLAPLDAAFTIEGTARRAQRWVPSGKITLDARAGWKKESTWEEIFQLVAPYISSYKPESNAKRSLENSLETEYHQSIQLDDQNFKTIKIQLEAHKLIEVQPNKDGVEFLRLTPKGRTLMMQLRTVKVDN